MVTARKYFTVWLQSTYIARMSSSRLNFGKDTDRVTVDYNDITILLTGIWTFSSA